MRGPSGPYWDGADQRRIRTTRRSAGAGPPARLSKKAVQADPRQRYDELSEFVFDLRHPNKALMGPSSAPLIERNPLLFWQALSLMLVLAVVGVLFLRFGVR